MHGLHDVQSLPDERGIPIDRVGVKNLSYPIVVLDRLQGKQETVADLTMSVSLPHDFKGTHMSRFIEILHSHYGEITMRTLPTILEELKTRLAAEAAHVRVSFPYFLERQAPASGAKALADYKCSFEGSINGRGADFVLGVMVPVTTLCPCSKAISDYGAHNQRGLVDIRVRTSKDPAGEPQLIWIEELIEVAENSASAPVYPLLKRQDERFVTMQAYDNPVFVEDVVRNVAEVLQDDMRVDWFQVNVENDESIHNHSAFATIEWHRT